MESVFSTSISLILGLIDLYLCLSADAFPAPPKLAIPLHVIDSSDVDDDEATKAPLSKKAKEKQTMAQAAKVKIF